MARGESGRIVLEINPSEKEALYNAVTKDGLTLKDWFLQKAGEYLHDRSQAQAPAPPALAEAPVTYRIARKSKVRPKSKKS